MNAPLAHPLQWPESWPRTESSRRQSGNFKTDTASALRNLQRQLSLMGAKNIVLSSNFTLGVENPSDPGVCAFFEYDGMRLAIPCDRWSRISHNIQAIALTVEAMRGMERWGAKHMIRAMFTGFKQLPAGDSEPWYRVLKVDASATALEVSQAYHLLCKKHHPDVGGSHDDMLRIQRAYEKARASLCLSV